MDQKQSKKCYLCGKVFYRDEMHNDWAWSIIEYCGFDCRLIISHMRRIFRSGKVKRAYEIVEQEFINLNRI